MTKKIVITVDVEKDVSDFLYESYLGVENAVPSLLGTFKELEIKADFFITANVANKYPEIVKQIVREGHYMGCHGLQHELIGVKRYRDQLNDISKATTILGGILGANPKMFRAPAFSVNSDTIKVLESLGYTIDSSVIPGRIRKKSTVFNEFIPWRIYKRLPFLNLYNFKNAPIYPYHPSYKNVSKKGKALILEIPLTENPFLNGVPIGMGYLNYVGLEKTIEAIINARPNYVTFLIHPWELVDLSQYYQDLPQWVYDVSSSSFKLLSILLKYLKKDHILTNLQDLTTH